MTTWARAILGTVLAVFAGLLLTTSVGAAPSFPTLTGRVVDDANVLSAPTRQSLDAKLEALETKTSRQLVVVTVPSLQGYSVEDYGYQLGRAWGIGEKGKNNGVLLLVAPNERRVRVEVGYGLEGVLTDALSSVLLQERVLPRFRARDIEGGVVAGADALIDQLSLPDEEAKARVAAAARPEPQGPSTSVPTIVLALLGLWVVLGLFGTITGGRGHRMDLWLLPLLLLMSGSGHGGRRSRGGFRGGGGSFGGGGASGSW